jgi:pantetheine-phosphate adenylyltransferase
MEPVQLLNGFNRFLPEISTCAKLRHYSLRNLRDLCGFASILYLYSMQRIAVFPGSFDPITRGHESIVRRVLPLFDKVIVAIGVNSHKQYYFQLEKRKAWIEQTFKGIPGVVVESFTGLTIDYCRKMNAKFIVRGLRTTTDLEFEKAIAQMNKSMADDIETLFILPTPELSAINSTIIRDIVRNGGDASPFVPEGIDLKL